jgi:hypothetical protein
MTDAGPGRAALLLTLGVAGNGALVCAAVRPTILLVPCAG